MPHEGCRTIIASFKDSRLDYLKNPAQQTSEYIFITEWAEGMLVMWWAGQGSHIPIMMLMTVGWTLTHHFSLAGILSSHCHTPYCPGADACCIHLAGSESPGRQKPQARKCWRLFLKTLTLFCHWVLVHPSEYKRIMDLWKLSRPHFWGNKTWEHLPDAQGTSLTGLLFLAQNPVLL